MRQLSLKRFLAHLKIRKLDLLFLVLPIIGAIISLLIAEYIFKTYIGSLIQNTKALDISSLDKLKSLSSKAENSLIEVKSIVDSLRIPKTSKANTNIENLPPLDKIMFKQEVSNLVVSAIYISDTQKFVVINDRIYKEGSVGPFFKVLSIDKDKVQIQINSKEVIWLRL